jgi:PAS domain S-box-containing protein
VTDKLTETAKSLLPYGFLLNSWLKSADAKIAVDKEGNVIAISEEAMPLFHYHPSEVVGKAVEMLVPAAFAEAHKAHRGGYVARPRHRAMGEKMNLHGRRKDGSEFPCVINLVYYYDPEGLWVEATVRMLPDGQISTATTEPTD